jgi:A/G-specific adenine glycosylase
VTRPVSIATGRKAVRGLRRALLRWYDKHKRELPWRKARDPYAIWISETMLQQTRVDTVIPYYERFIDRFPDIASLAAAERDDVLSLWSGLGYYSRARALHRAAGVVAREYGGEFPETASELRELPGIGPYTAGAIAAIAFDRPEPAVDGNVIRVLSRLFGLRDDVSKPAIRRLIESHARELAEGPRPGDLCQALMELGALLCVPRTPRCLLCPLRKSCAAFEAGDAATLPNKPKKKAPKKIEAVAILLSRGHRVLAVKRPEKGLLGGLWDLPGGELQRGEEPESGLARTLSETLGLATRSAPKAMGQVGHLFTHRRLILHLFSGEVAAGRLRCRAYDDHRWLASTELHQLPHGTLTDKAFRLLEVGGPSGANP